MLCHYGANKENKFPEGEGCESISYLLREVSEDKPCISQTGRLQWRTSFFETFPVGPNQ